MSPWLLGCLVIILPEVETMKTGLSPCPNSPNCVTTMARDTGQAMPPLFFTSTRDEAQDRVRKLVQSMPRTAIVRDEPGYLKVEFTSRLFRFVDDVEFAFDPSGRIDFRSASRTGYYDFGANRRRMLAITTRLTQSPEISLR